MKLVAIFAGSGAGDEGKLATGEGELLEALLREVGAIRELIEKA